MIASIIAREFIPPLSEPLLWLATLCGWSAVALVANRISVLQRSQVGAMVVVGLAALLYVQYRTGSAAWLNAVTQSLPLVTMILSVGFIKRIALKAIAADSPNPTGFSAYRDTVFTVAVFGAFINISAVILVADHLARLNPLSQHGASAVTRAFSTCVSWSPFFAGLAVVIIYAPTFSVPMVIVQGIPVAILGVSVAVASAWLTRSELKSFEGFPVNWSSLWIPTVLAIVVVVVQYTLPFVSLLPAIALSALLVVATGLLFSEGAVGSVRTVHKHITEDLPLSYNELTLLMAVGVLATGLVTWVELGDIHWQLPAFNGWMASAVFALMIGIAMIGIHPVVSIALATSLLAPVEPNPELLATTLLLGWGFGTLACPLSGTHLVVQGRYGIPSFTGATTQWPYVAVMFVLGSMWLNVLSYLHNI